MAPFYRFPNTFVSGLSVQAAGYNVAYINVVGAATPSGTQNKNGGVIAYANPKVTQTRFHAENDAQIVGRPLTGMRVGGYPALVTGTASGSMGVAAANSSLAFGAVTPREFVVFQLKPTMKLGNVTTTVLTTPGADWGGGQKRAKQNGINVVYTRRIITSSAGAPGTQLANTIQGWNYITGVPVRTTGQQDTFATDRETSITRALPGDHVWLDAGKTIKTQAYSPDTD